MKAEVTYNDFTGTAAADGSDQITLNKYLGTLGVDTDRYRAIGVEFYSGLRSCSHSIICVDKVKSTEDKRQIVKVHLSRDMKYEDFFILFKRFKVILTDGFCSEDELDKYDTINL